MFEQLPSLGGFQPHCYHAGPSRFYLPLLYDLVAALRPEQVVVLGWDGDVHFALCQAAVESGLSGVVTSIREGDDGPAASDDDWLAGVARADEFYRGVSRLVESGREDALAHVSDNSIALLVVHDFASSASIRARIEAFQTKLTPSTVTVVHSIDGDRESGPRDLWNELRSRHAAELRLGQGIGITTAIEAERSLLLKEIFTNDAARATVTQLYVLAADRIDAVARVEHAERENRLLQLRQIWQPTLLQDRLQMQATIDHLQRHTEHLERVHKWDVGQAQHRERLLEEQLATLQKKRGGGDHSAPLQPEQSRKSAAEKVLREISRIPRNLRKLLRRQ